MVAGNLPQPPPQNVPKRFGGSPRGLNSQKTTSVQKPLGSAAVKAQEALKSNGATVSAALRRHVTKTTDPKGTEGGPSAKVKEVQVSATSSGEASAPAPKSIEVVMPSVDGVIHNKGTAESLSSGTAPKDSKGQSHKTQKSSAGVGGTSGPISTTGKRTVRGAISIKKDADLKDLAESKTISDANKVIASEITSFFKSTVLQKKAKNDASGAKELLDAATKIMGNMKFSNPTQQIIYLEQMAQFGYGKQKEEAASVLMKLERLKNSNQHVVVPPVAEDKPQQSIVMDEGLNEYIRPKLHDRKVSMFASYSNGNLNTSPPTATRRLSSVGRSPIGRRKSSTFRIVEDPLQNIKEEGENAVTYRCPLSEINMSSGTTLPGRVMRGCKDAPADRAALVDIKNNEWVTHSNLVRAIHALAYSLRQYGVKKGTVVVMVSCNSITFVEMFLALSLLGAVPAVIPNHEKAWFLFMRDVKALKATFLFFTNDIFMHISRALLKAGTGNMTVFVEGEPPSISKGSTHMKVVQVSNMITTKMIDTYELVDMDDLLCLFIEHATQNGSLRATRHTHSNASAQLAQLGHIFQNTADGSERTYMLTLPFYQVPMGLLGITCYALATKSTLVLVDNQALQPIELADIVLAEEVSYLITSLTVLDMLDSVEGEHLDNLKAVLVRGQPTAAGAIRGYTHLNENARYRICTFLSHISFSVSHMTYFTESEFTDNVGAAVPNTFFKIVDRQLLTSLGPMLVGEIWVKGPQVCSTHVNLMDGAVRSSTDLDGFVHTGIMGYVDMAGNLRLVPNIRKAQEEETIGRLRAMSIAPFLNKAATNLDQFKEKIAEEMEDGPKKAPVHRRAVSFVPEGNNGKMLEMDLTPNTLHAKVEQVRERNLSFFGTLDGAGSSDVMSEHRILPDSVNSFVASRNDVVRGSVHGRRVSVSYASARGRDVVHWISEELESDIVAHPFVHSALVTSQFDPYGKQYPKAFVKLSDGVNQKNKVEVLNEISEYLEAAQDKEKKALAEFISEAVPDKHVRTSVNPALLGVGIGKARVSSGILVESLVEEVTSLPSSDAGRANMRKTFTSQSWDKISEPYRKACFGQQIQKMTESGSATQVTPDKPKTLDWEGQKRVQELKARFAKDNIIRQDSDGGFLTTERSTLIGADDSLVHDIKTHLMVEALDRPVLEPTASRTEGAATGENEWKGVSKAARKVAKETKSTGNAKS